MRQVWMAALLTLPIAAQAGATARAGELMRLTQTVVESHADGSVSTTTVESWGPGFPRPGVVIDASECQGSGSGVPPPGDEWPPIPGPETSNGVSSVSRSNHYSDGWTMSNTYTRTVTRNPNGSYSDGPWVETSRNASGPGTHMIGGPPCPVPQ